MQSVGNAIITFFMPFDLAPCDKKCRSEGEGSGHEANIRPTSLESRRDPGAQVSSLVTLWPCPTLSRPPLTSTHYLHMVSKLPCDISRGKEQIFCHTFQIHRARMQERTQRI